MLSFYFTQAQTKEDIRNAGLELIIFQKHIYIGFGLTIVGQGLMTLGFFTPALLSPPPLIILGILTSLVGIVYLLESYLHIGKAGKYLSLE